MLNNVVRLEFAQFGHFTKFKVFRSPEPMVPGSMPEPIADNLKTMFFVDSNVPDGDNYYRVEVEREGEFILSEEMYIRVTNEWSPTALNGLSLLLHEDEVTLGEGKVIAWRAIQGLNIPLEPIMGYTTEAVGKTSEGLVFNNGRFLATQDPTAVDNYFANADGLTLLAVAKPSELNTSDTDFRGPISIVNTALKGGFAICHGNYTSSGKNVLACMLRRDPTEGAVFYSDTVDIDTSKYTLAVCGYSVSENTVTMGIDGAKRIFSPAFNTLKDLNGFSALRVNIGSAADNGANTVYRGTIKAVGFANTKLREVDRLKVEGWLSHRYGLNVNLPDNHPYKWVKPLVADDNKPYGITSSEVDEGTLVTFGVSGEFESLNYYLSTAPISEVNKDSHLIKTVSNTSLVDSTAYGDYFVTLGAVKDGREYLGGTTLIPFYGYEFYPNARVFSLFSETLKNKLGGFWESTNPPVYETMDLDFPNGALHISNASTPYVSLSGGENYLNFTKSFDLTVEAKMLKYMSYIGATANLASLINIGLPETITLFTGFGLTNDGRVGYYEYHNGSVRSVKGVTSIPLNTKFRVSYRYDHSTKTLRIYLNGALEVTYTVPSAPTRASNQKLTIGSAYTNYTSEFLIYYIGLSEGVIF